jgi:LemA protein
MSLAFGMSVGLFLLIALVLMFVVITYNTVVALRRRCERAWANIDVALKQRHDTLPNLVAAVRGQMGFEQTVLEEVTRLRSAYSPKAPLREQAQVSESTSAAVRSLFAVVEAYPELRSQENVMDLQEEIARLETVIGQRRELFNEQVTQYNTTIASIPAVLLAGTMGWKRLDLFKATDEDRARPDASLPSVTGAGASGAGAPPAR